MDDIKLQFEGFSPPDFIRNYFQELMEQVKEEAPTWSTVNATVHRMGREFRAVVSITSQAGEFFATASSKRVTEVGRILLQRLRRQLGKWKATRFSRESIRRSNVISLPLSEDSYADGSG